MKAYRLVLVSLFVLALNGRLSAQTVDPPGGPVSLDADKNTYSAGEVVTLSGEGWVPGETVTIAMRPIAPNRQEYTVHSEADPNGRFVNQDFVPQDSDIGTRYIAVASGSVTGAIVQTQFTVTGKPLETGKPDVVKMHGPISQDKDLRKLPAIPTMPESEPRRLGRHPRKPTEAEEEETERAAAAGAVSSSSVDALHAFLNASTPRIVSFAIPGPTLSFDGVNSATSACNCLPPDTNGDVGPNHYIQDVNNGIRIFDKTGAPLTSFISFNAFFAGLGNSTPCGNQNRGDGVVFYDHLADRWVVTDFAFPAFPGTSFWQCMGVSKTPNPVSGGWWLYALRVDPANPSFLGDYPKFGLWHNAYYLTMNMFLNNTTFNGVRVYALDRGSMINGGSPNAIGFTITPAALGDAYSLVPATFRYGAPPPSRDEYLLAINSPADGSTVQNKVFAWRFHADFTTPANSVFGTGPTHTADQQITVNNFVDAYQGSNTLIVPQVATTAKLDTLGDKLMHPMYYQNMFGVESLWATHTVNNNLNGTGPTAIRWYQFDVTGSTIPAAPLQQQTFNNGDSLWRWMPSLALDSNGNLAIDYTVSSAALNPSIRYAGRLVGDAANTLGQGEELLIQGAGHQTSTSGRWGDYSATGVDVSDGCTFWHTNEYFAATTSGSWGTRIGTFKFPSCVSPQGILQGIVKSQDTGLPISGATVTAGNATTTTGGTGQYQLTLPIGSYTVKASAPGFLASSATEVGVNANATTPKDFALASAATFACVIDTTQADFESGVANGVETNSSPGDVKLVATAGGAIDQQLATGLSNTGTLFSTATWQGQTFVPAVSGALTQLDVSLFCSVCGTTTGGPITVEIRNVAGTAPGPTVLATATIPGFSSGVITFYSATFTAPARLNAGTTYAYTLRGAAVVGSYAAIRSASNLYASGAQFSSANAGVTWTATATDLGFRAFMSTTLVAGGDLTSSVKDANPLDGNPAMWGTLAWTAATPAGTAVKFQAAASNNPAGPFLFVGPGNNPAAFFTTSGASLAQFNGSRYLQYKAFLSSTSNTVTPTLSDVTICFDNRPLTTLVVQAANGTYGGTTTLSATLTANALPVPNKPVAFTLNANPVGIAITDPSGTATLPNVSIAGIHVGSYPGAVGASFTTDGSYIGSSGANSLAISGKPASVTPDAASKTYGQADPPLTGTLSGFLAADGVTATYARTAGDTVADSPYTISATLLPAPALENYLVTYNTATFTINPKAASVTPDAKGKVFGAPDPVLTGTLVGFLPTDNVTAVYTRTAGDDVAGSPYTISAMLSPAAVLGNYAIIYNTAPFTIGAADAIISVSGYTDEYDGLAHGATGTATGVNGENLNALLNLGASYTNVPGGTANWAFAGNTNYNPSANSVAIVINKAPLTVTADDQSRLYSYPNPALTATFAGFKHGETLASSGVTGAPVLTTAATPLSAAGPYPIHIAPGDLAANNYSFSLVDGTLTVYISGVVGLDSAYIGAAKAVADSFDSSAGYASSVGANVLILSNGPIDVAGAKIFGSVLSTQGSVLVEAGSQVKGNVSAGTTISNQGVVNGSIVPSQPSALLAGNPVPSCGAFTVNPALSGGKFTYSNGDLSIASGAVLTLANGSYCFHNVTLSGNASLRVSGPVAMKLTGILNASGGSLVNTTQVPSKLQIASSFTGANGVTIAGNTSAYLTVYAPTTNVTVTGGSPVYGALLGKTLTITGNSQIHYDVLLQQVWSIFGF